MDFVNSRDFDYANTSVSANKFKRINRFTIFTGITKTLQPKDYKFFAFSSTTVTFSLFSSILIDDPD